MSTNIVIFCIFIVAYIPKNVYKILKKTLDKVNSERYITKLSFHNNVYYCFICVFFNGIERILAMVLEKKENSL